MQRYCNGHAIMKIILCKLNFMFFINKSEKQEKEADTNFFFLKILWYFYQDATLQTESLI